MTEHDVALILGRLSAAYPHTTVDEAMALIWAEQLADIPRDEAIEIARRLIRSCRFFPTISEFRESWTVARRTHQFHNPFVLTYTYPKIDPSEAAERWREVHGILADHPTVRLEGTPDKPARIPGPPPPPCGEDNHAWCLADDVARRRLDPARWAAEDEHRRRLKMGGR